jgi:hypothetical protein
MRSRSRLRRALGAILLTAATGAFGSAAEHAAARAEPIRLRADAFAATAAPAGLLDLQAGGDLQDWLRADAVVWLGSGDGIDSGTGTDADVLIIAARARAPKDQADATLGRFVLTVGALRPLHLDGLDGRARLPHRLVVEAFAGIPVETSLDSRSWDWVSGGRVGRRLGDWGSAGVAYLEQRDHGELSTRELGLDAGGAITKTLDAGGRLAIDLISTGIAEAQVSAVKRWGHWRAEAYVTHRSPSHLLPATSLFSVLGDVPSERAGAHVTWRAAPRLDLEVDGGARRVGDDGDPQHSGDDYGADLTARAVLRLDDRGKGALSCELRRLGAVDGGWTGARATARVPLTGALTASTELELVRPDNDADGSLWPWALAALGWHQGAWDAAIAIEASATAQYSSRLDAIARLGRRWELP